MLLFEFLSYGDWWFLHNFLHFLLSSENAFLSFSVLPCTANFSHCFHSSWFQWLCSNFPHLIKHRKCICSINELFHPKKTGVGLHLTASVKGLLCKSLNRSSWSVHLMDYFFWVDC